MMAVRPQLKHLWWWAGGERTGERRLRHAPRDRRLGGGARRGASGRARKGARGGATTGSRCQMPVRARSTPPACPLAERREDAARRYRSRCPPFRLPRDCGGGGEGEYCIYVRLWAVADACLGRTHNQRGRARPISCALPCGLRRRSPAASRLLVLGTSARNANDGSAQSFSTPAHTTY